MSWLKPKHIWVTITLRLHDLNKTSLISSIIASQNTAPNQGPQPSAGRDLQHQLCGFAIKQHQNSHTWLPHIRLCAAIMIDFIPEAQTLLTVVVGVQMGRPKSSKLHKQLLFKGRLPLCWCFNKISYGTNFYVTPGYPASIIWPAHLHPWLLSLETSVTSLLQATDSGDERKQVRIQPAADQRTERFLPLTARPLTLRSTQLKSHEQAAASC